MVEDDAGMARVLRRGLSEEGYAVDVCNDGDEAIWRVRELGYEAVVLDVMLPGRNGFEICRSLRDAEVATPVLMLTARHDVTDRVRGLDAGADDYVLKPFSFVELLARLRAVLRRGELSRPPVLRTLDLVFDPAARRAWRGDTELALSAKETALLELFMRHPGATLTRTAIRESLWDTAFEADSNIVDQYVSYLRRKVDKPFGREDIETVRGTGYRLRAATG